MGSTASPHATTADLDEPRRDPGSTTGSGLRSGSGAGVLVVYYSRAGENYADGGRTHLAVGNTEVAAGYVADLLGCDVHRLEAADPYPEDYDATVARNVAEQDADARPALAAPLPDAAGYDVVVLAGPIWNVRPPMLMSTAAEGLDLTGKRVLPLVTYAVSGLGSTAQVYAGAAPGAEIGEGLAVRGEDVYDARPTVEAWLTRTGLLIT